MDHRKKSGALAADFKRAVRKHYRTQGRHGLPWRNTRDPYAILVSEIMLQQTQVSRVEGYYGKFLARFPDFAALAGAGTGELLAAWQGLGYNRRALALRRLAETVMREHGGKLPEDRALLARLPGIGKGTSGSLMAFAFNKPEIFIETNIRRAFIHHFFPRTRRGVTDAELERCIQETLDRAHPREWYWALMDYGAALGRAAAKTGSARAGSVNPNRRSAHYRKQSAFRGSDRELRGRILRYLLSERAKDTGIGGSGIDAGRLAAAVGIPVGGSDEAESDTLRRVLAQLAREGFITEKRNLIYINEG